MKLLQGSRPNNPSGTQQYAIYIGNYKGRFYDWGVDATPANIGVKPEDAIPYIEKHFDVVLSPDQKKKILEGVKKLEVEG